MKQPESLTGIGKAMRQLYEMYGAEAVLTNEKYLINGLGDLVRIDYTPKLRSQMALAMDAGLGRLYLEQLERGKPDDSFNQRVYNLLTLDAGLSDSSAREISGYFNEMMGWNESPDSETDSESDSASENESTYQKILYYDEQGRTTDKEHAYKTVTQILDKNGNLINEIFSYVERGNICSEKASKSSKGRSIICGLIILVALVAFAFIIANPSVIANLFQTGTIASIETYTITYDANGGSHAPAKQTVIKDTEFEISNQEPIRWGYEFLGWNSSKSRNDNTGLIYSVGKKYRINWDLTLYAQWEKIETETTAFAETYTVTYDANGGTGAPTEQTVIKGTEFEINSQVPTREGYVFSGWNVIKNGGGMSYFPGEKYTCNTSFILYAQWVPQNVKNGWISINDKWQYYQDGTLVTGWKHIDGAGYYFDESGFMVTGWRYINDAWYYFVESGKMMIFDWLELEGKWYFFDDTGRMVTGRHTIGGVDHLFADDGHCIE